MPDTRPNTVFKEIEGKPVCQACLNFDKRKNIDWGKKYDELKGICRFYRGIGKPYDCAIPISGGKDSHFLTYIAKELGLNPLLVRIADGFSMSTAGRKNIENIRDIFNCDMVEFTPSTDVYRRMTRIFFEQLGKFPFVDQSIYTASCDIINHLGIQLVLFGEDPLQEYGTTEEPLKDIEVLSRIMSSYDGDFWKRNNFTDQEVSFLQPPSVARKTNFLISPIFVSHYMQWSGVRNYEVAKRFGFQPLNEHAREGCLENYDSIDSWGWQLSQHLKYRKLGFGRVTDIACRWIREGLITRDKAIEYVNMQDRNCDTRVIDDFLRFTGYTKSEFHDIAETWWNRDLFECIGGFWLPKFIVGQALK